MMSKRVEQFREYLNNKLDVVDMQSLDGIIKDYEERIDLLYNRLEARDNVVDIMLEAIADNDDAIDYLKEIILKLISQ